MDDLLCPECGQKLGRSVGGLIILQHKGRTAVVLGVMLIRCDRPGCAGVWRNPAMLDVDEIVTAATDLVRKAAARRSPETQPEPIGAG